MDFKHITVAGSGVLGSQIAFQTAFKGFNVAVYDIDEEAIDRTKNRIMNLKVRYQQDLDKQHSRDHETSEYGKEGI